MKSVLNALRIVEEVAELQPIGVGDLSRRLGLPKTSVQRALVTLHEAGWLRQEGDGAARWCLSARALAIGRGSSPELLRSVAGATLGALRAETEETALLFVRDGDQVVAIEGLDGLQPVRAHASVGTTAPLHASASGKAILAELPQQEVEAYLSQGLSAHTEATITQAPRLRAELDRVRRQGYAVHKNEFLAGVVAIGAAIRGSAGTTLGAVVVAGPSDRLPRPRVKEIGARVAAAAARIGEQLG